MADYPTKQQEQSQPSSTMATLAFAAATFAAIMSIVSVALVNNLGEDTVLLANECGNGSIDMSGIATAASLASLAHNMSSMTVTHQMMSNAQCNNEHVFVHAAYNNYYPQMVAADARMASYCNQLMPIGTHTARMAEASDAYGNAAFLVDGQDGNVQFPHGNLKTILTIGEADATTGYMPTGVPDGMGAYKLNDVTMRFISQSESYGYMGGYPTYSMPVNGGTAKFTGSKVYYVDYDIAMMKEFMSHSNSAAPMVRGAGSLIETVYNLAGNKVGARNAAANIDVANVNPHYSQTSASGIIVTSDATDVNSQGQNAWTFMSFCSAHLEEKHQWGTGIGFESDIYLVPEEWTELDAARSEAHGFAGLPLNVIDVATKTLYAAGALGLGGYEKAVEVNCGNANYVCVSPSGYNGNFGGDAKPGQVRRKQAKKAKRADNTDWVFPQNIVPARMYIGAKGYKADGTACGTSCNFLEKNGLAYGKVYGFAVETSVADRDAFHKGAFRNTTGTITNGVWAATAWQWDGTVKNMEELDTWEFQESPMVNGASVTTHKFWTAKGRDAEGAKTEHNSPYPGFNQYGTFVQGSTAGYYGIYSTPTLKTTLDGLAAGVLPQSISGATYEMIEGESKIDDRIELNGKGLRADGQNSTLMNDGTDKTTFEDIDGLEWIMASDGEYFIIQEDGGNKYGERMFISKRPAANVLSQYYFIALAGGSKNSRGIAKVGVPAKTAGTATAYEFSGVADFSGILTQTTMGGFARRTAEATVAINDKLIALGLQAHGITEGIIQAFGLDRGGQIFLYKPSLN